MDAVLVGTVPVSLFVESSVRQRGEYLALCEGCGAAAPRRTQEKPQARKRAEDRHLEVACPGNGVSEIKPGIDTENSKRAKARVSARAAPRRTHLKPQAALAAEDRHLEVMSPGLPGRVGARESNPRRG